MRNLLGRLNARSADDLGRIASWWQISLTGADRSRHVGMLYREMTDLRTARSAWERLDPGARTIVRELAVAESGPLTAVEIASLTELAESSARAAALRLLDVGILSRQGDNQEIAVGAVPKLLLPRELAQVFRRVQDEADAGDLSKSSLRVLIEMLDDPEIEEAARIWGINVIPGLRRRADLVSELLGQMSSTERIERVVKERGRTASTLFGELRNTGGGPVPLDAALKAAGLTMPEPSEPDHLRAASRLRSTLTSLETALLVCHTYRRDGTRWLFIPREILDPHEVVATLPLRQLQPLSAGTVPHATSLPAYALAWDLLTVLREITTLEAPIWMPGEPLARTWQRRINRRLWFAGEDMPPRGYLGFILHLAHNAALVVAATSTVPGGLEKGGLRPVVSPSVREWRRLDFVEQTKRLQSVWIASEPWVEGREREEIDVWGADWRGFRSRLLTALDAIEDDGWFQLDDLAARLAEQNPGLIGPTFTAASSRSSANDRALRTAAIAQIIEVELETALHWFGRADLGTTSTGGAAVRVRSGAAEAVPEDDGPVLTVDASGLVTLHQPSPLHVWSLSAFADPEGVSPEALYQLRPGSVSRALAAGFDLDQITMYLERQQGAALPDAIAAMLREWTVGYRRVRVRRALLLQVDTGEMRDALRTALAAEGFEVMDNPDNDVGLSVTLRSTGASPANAEQDLLAALRAHGFAGQFESRSGATSSLPSRDSA